VPAEQQGHLELMDLNNALAQLPPDQREALILVGAEGFSYEDAATISGCAVGTVKSRVNRARAKVSELLKAPPSEEPATETPLPPHRPARRASS
jgi:RNA polymerase sigma-70 factor (ECF subfamily)